MVRYIRANDELHNLTLRKSGWVSTDDEEWRNSVRGYLQGNLFNGELIPIKSIGNAEYGIVGTQKARGRYSSTGGYVPYKLENDIIYIARSSPIKKDVAISWMKEFAANSDYDWIAIGKITDRDGYDEFADVRVVKQNKDRFFKYFRDIYEKFAGYSYVVPDYRIDEFANKLVQRYGIDLVKLICAYVCVCEYETNGANKIIDDQMYNWAKSICPFGYNEIHDIIWGGLNVPNYASSEFPKVVKCIMEM